MKKLLTLILAMLMLLSFFACRITSNRVTNSENNNATNNNENESTNNGNTDSDNNGLNVNKTICTSHNYVNNICSVCNCSLWNGEIDTSWYSVVNTEFNISTAEEFAGFAKLVNDGTDFHDVTIKLCSHLDLNAKEWAPIGFLTGTFPNEIKQAFAGTFDGAGYNITNFVITAVASSNSTNSVGLFGYSQGKIENIILDKFRIDVKMATSSLDGATLGDIYVGGISGYNSGIINNCKTNGLIEVTTASHNVIIGGVAGENEGNIKSCINNSNVSGEGCYIYGGGVVGRNWEIGSIEKCSSSGDISGIGTYDCHIGGLIGQIGNKTREKSVIKNCYSTGNIFASSEQKCFAGGLVGFLYNGAEIYNSYALGNIIGESSLKNHYTNLNGNSNSYAGGLVGYIDYAYYTRSLSVHDCWVTSGIDLKTENGDGYAGFICGNYDEVLFSNCYYSNEVLLKADHIITFGTPAGSEVFMNIAFYQNKMTAWDGNIWNLADKTYPTLK